MLNIDRWKINGDKILWTQSLKKQGQGSLRDGKERVRTEHSQKCSGKWQAEAQAMGLGFVILWTKSAT